MGVKTRQVTLKLREEDVEWLEKMYGDSWPKRMEQHIHLEIELRRYDRTSGLKMRKPWDY